VRSHWRNAWPVGFDPPFGCHGSQSLATHAPLAKRREFSLRAVAVVALADVVLSQCEAVDRLRGPLDSTRRLGAMGRGRWRPMRRWQSGANCRQPRSRGFVRGARAPSVTPGFSRGQRELESAILTLWPSSKRGDVAAQSVVVVVSYCFCCRSFRCRNEKVGCTTVHTITPRIKNASDASNALRLENFHPRTVHIFSRDWSRNMRSTTTDSSAFASVARRPRREAFLFVTAFPGVTSALKRRRTPGYSPTTPTGWYCQSPRVHASHQKRAPMCTFLKNVVRFASRVARLTCTKNSVHATCGHQKMVHNDLHECVYHRHCAVLGALCELGGGFEFVVVVPPGRPPWNGTAQRYQPGGVHHRAHFFAVLFVRTLDERSAYPHQLNPK